MAAEYNITINKNADFVRSYQVKEDSIILDLTDYTIEAALMENFRATTTTSFVATVTNAATGLFQLSLTDVVTAGLEPGTQNYDVVLTDPNGTKTRLMQGRAFVKQGVTT